MSFSENLRAVRKERGITQERLAELLDVSRQAVSKWESGDGYPETEKLIAISKELNISLDYLLNDECNVKEKTKEERVAVYPPSGKISIKSYDKNIYLCQAIRCSEVVAPARNTPAFTLLGIDNVGFLGPHSVILGFYEHKEDVQREMNEIFEAINRGEISYELKYASEVELKGILGLAKLKH